MKNVSSFIKTISFCFNNSSPKLGKESCYKDELEEHLKQQKLSRNRIEKYRYAFHQLKPDTFS
ncbi:MAG TPA: hypothetical protein PKY67_06295 [Nitrosomonas sp.]|jgi:hypothetical protein|nr:hypothetical protein [Nitrosomonas sp.]